MLQVKILTPEGEVWKGQVSSLSLEADGGRMGILPSHADGVYPLVPGLLCMNSIPRFEVAGKGFLYLEKGKAAVLLDEKPKSRE